MGQRPGEPSGIETEALKGRDRSSRPFRAAAAVFSPFPRRCPGLSSLAPSGNENVAQEPLPRQVGNVRNARLAVIHCRIITLHGIVCLCLRSSCESDSEVANTKPDSGEKLFRVLPRQVDQTVSAALREWLPGQAWSEIRRLLKSRRITINGNLCVDAGRRLRLTDVVKVLPQSLAPPPDELDLRIVYLDKHVVVVEKPSGMTTTRHSEEQDMSSRRRQLQPTLDELLPRAIAKIEARGAKNTPGKKGPKKGIRQVRAVHRLDRDTSGLLVFARTPEAQQHLEQQFRTHTTKRRYLAVVRGAVESQTIESRLVRDRGDGRRGSTTLPNVGRRAVTHVRAVERLGDYTLIECRLETGRTHQIRIHLSESGHPLCGDKVYGQPLFRGRARHQRRARAGPLRSRVGVRASDNGRADALRGPAAPRFRGIRATVAERRKTAETTSVGYAERSNGIAESRKEVTIGGGRALYSRSTDALDDREFKERHSLAHRWNGSCAAVSERRTDFRIRPVFRDGFGNPSYECN